MPPFSGSADTCFSSSVSLPISSEEIQADYVGPDRTEELEPQIDKNNPECPIIIFPPKLLEELRKPWKDCLIIKLIKKSLPIADLYSRTKALWDIHGKYTLTPLNNWYFIVKFDRPEEYDKVINGLPWIIMKHSISVRKWEPNFATSDAKETVSMTWIKLPNIQMELYKEEELFRFAQPFGKPIKIDRRCARICVQIDMLKPEMSYRFLGVLYKAEYDEYILKSAFLGQAEYDEYILNSAAKTSVKYFKWEFPPVGFKKLNTDGSYLVGVDKASFGGLFRNEKGEWLRGYYGNIGSKSVNYAELWSIYQGLLIAQKWNLKNILVETDSKVAVTLILLKKEMHDEDRHPLEDEIEECRKILENLRGNIKHVFREGNYCADKMAFLGGKQNKEMMEFENPPDELKDLLLADAMGIKYARAY